MTKFQPTTIVGVVNDIVNMAEDFVDGKPFSLELSNKILKTFDLEHELEKSVEFDAPVGQQYQTLSTRLSRQLKKKVGTKYVRFKFVRRQRPTLKIDMRRSENQSVPIKIDLYLQHLEKAKAILNSHKPVKLKKDICYISTEDKPTKLMVALMTRYINIAHQCQYIIVLNDEIVYVPSQMRSRDKEEFGRYVKLAILEHKDQTKTKLVKGLKTNTRFLASQMMKTVVTA